MLLGWASVLHHPHHMADLISRNWIIHFEDVLEEIEHEKADWEEGKYEEAGIHLATIL